MELETSIQDMPSVVARRERPWHYAFVGLGLALALGALLLPVSTFDRRLQLIVSGVCSQAHFLYIGPFTMPLCARNTGIYAGFLSTLLYLALTGRGRAAGLPALPFVGMLVLGVLAMGVDGLNSLALDIGGYNLYPPDNRLRVVTGLGMGAAIGVFVLAVFNVSLRADALLERPMLGGWRDLFGIAAVGAALYSLLFFAPAGLYYPLAIFSVFGITGVLFAMNTFVTAIVTGFEARVLSLRQLARPATIGLVLTALELAALAGFRLWFERSLGM